MEAATKLSARPSVNAGASVDTAGGLQRCDVADGTLPGVCASMVFPYIAKQENDPKRYSNDDAMRAGTLFPGLNLPFHKEIRSRFPQASNALTELMALDFAIQELGLYLNTHRDDREVQELYWSYVRLGKQGREKYVEQYGPLCETDITPGSFKWLDNPWPWELEGND